MKIAEAFNVAWFHGFASNEKLAKPMHGTSPVYLPILIYHKNPPFMYPKDPFVCPKNPGFPL